MTLIENPIEDRNSRFDVQKQLIMKLKSLDENFDSFIQYLGRRIQ